MKRITNKNWMNYKRARNLAYLNQCEFSIDRMKKIKAHVDTRRIEYSKTSKYRKAYDYVDGLFVNADVKNVIVYLVSESCLKRVGLSGIGGCYDKLSKVVVVSKTFNFSGNSKTKDNTWSTIKAKVTIDEVIVHELLHYVSMLNGGDSNSIDVEEEFAYGNSLGYLRDKGHSDDEIIINNFLPYFIQAVNQRKIMRKVLVSNGYVVDEVATKTDRERKRIFKKLDSELFKETKTAAIEKARQLIQIYSEDDSYDNVKVENDNDSKFGMMDFSF